MAKREDCRENNDTIGVGRAYGFFVYNGKIADIQSELPKARKIAQVPEELILRLTKGVDSVDTRGDSELVQVVKMAQIAGMTHAIEASMPHVGNRKVSNELNTILNNIYASPLYAFSEQFSGEIVYKRGDKYCFKRS